MTQKEKYIGEAKLIEEARRKLLFKLGNGVVKTHNIANKAITAEKLADSIITDVITPTVTAAVQVAVQEALAPLKHIAMIRVD